MQENQYGAFRGRYFQYETRRAWTHHTRPRLVFWGRSGHASTAMHTVSSLLYPCRLALHNSPSPSQSWMLLTFTAEPEAFAARRPAPVELYSHGYARVVITASSFACTSRTELSTTTVKLRVRMSLSSVFHSLSFADSPNAPTAVRKLSARTRSLSTC